MNIELRQKGRYLAIRCVGVCLIFCAFSAAMSALGRNSEEKRIFAEQKEAGTYPISVTLTERVEWYKSDPHEFYEVTMTIDGVPLKDAGKNISRSVDIGIGYSVALGHHPKSEEFNTHVRTNMEDDWVGYQRKQTVTEMSVRLVSTHPKHWISDGHDHLTEGTENNEDSE